MTETEYRFIKELGKGSFGTVSLVRRDDKFLAKKEITDTLDILVGIKEMNVTRVASKLSPHVVRIEDHNIFIPEKGKYQMDQYLEYCHGGCLDAVLDEEREYPDRGVLIGGVTKRIDNLSNIASALAALHINGIFHMDIKTENILYRDSGMCLCDFSNSIVNLPWKKNYHPPPNQYQSLIYRSPDIALLNTRWGNAEKSDVWAFGIVMLETLGLSERILEMEVQTDDQINKFKSILSRFKSRDSQAKVKGHQLFGRIFPDTISAWDLMKDSSNGYGYLWCNLFARKIRDMDYEKLFSESVAYFEMRKCVLTDEERNTLHKIITEIVPKMLFLNHSSRLTMSEVCGLLGRDVNVEKPSDTSARNKDLGNMWGEIVEDMRDELRGVHVLYSTESIKIPDSILSYARAIAEVTMHRMTPPKNTVERAKFFRNIFGASLLISCEMFDVMIELDENEYIITDKMSLAELGPYVVDVTNQTSGLLLSILPTEEELNSL